MSKQKTVVVGMSGGVDSSVAALILKEQGYNVIGMFMKNWDENDADGQCKASFEYEDMVAVCRQIDIPYYSVNFVREYWDNVFVHFLDELRQGRTPNPDILCNREIKFKALLEKASEVGGDFLATGHYCRSRIENGRWQLLKGIDPNKDQSYFLHAIGQKALSKALFPVGGMVKTDLRNIARSHQLATSAKKDSTGICFIGKRDFREFIKQYIPYNPGDLVRLDGTIVGKHEGAAYYTIGQRKGMGLGGAGEPWFVVGKDIKQNHVYVEQGINHPALYCSELSARGPSWIDGRPPESLPYHCTAKVRYRQEDQKCTIIHADDAEVKVVFDNPQRAVTPGQSVVFYSDDVCLGGAVIV